MLIAQKSCRKVAVTWLLHYKNKGIKIIGVDCIRPIRALLRISPG